MANKKEQQDFSKLPENIDALIDQYLSGSMEDAEMDAFEQLYFNNEACFREVQMRADLRDILAEDAAAQASAPTTDKVTPAGDAPEPRMPVPAQKSSTWKYALAAAAAIILLVIFKQSLDPENNPIQANLNNGPELLAEHFGQAFQISNNLDFRVSDHLRSQYFLTILAPQPPESSDSASEFHKMATRLNIPVYENGIDFKWILNKEGNPVNDPLFLYILNNNDEVLFEYEVRNGHLQFQETLEPGLYYWTLDTPEETLYVNRFLVAPQ